MTEIINWCNTNNGFITGVFSVVGLLLSTIATIVSIRTARLPYKKKILLGSSMLIGAVTGVGLVTSPSTIGFEASATNIGNRTVNLTYVGYAIKSNGKFNRMYPISRAFDCKAILQPTECKGTQFMANEFVESFSKLDRN